MKKNRKDKRKVEEYQTYKFGDTIFNVEAIFKINGEKILVQSILKMTDKGIKQS